MQKSHSINSDETRHRARETKSNLLNRVSLTFLCAPVLICNFLKSFFFIISVIFFLSNFICQKVIRKKQKNAISPSQRRISSFSCVRFFKFPSKHNKKRPREEKKNNNFIISEAPATCVRRKKCSERFQGFLNMKKIVLFKYMYCNIFSLARGLALLLGAAECEPNSRSSPTHDAIRS